MKTAVLFLVKGVYFSERLQQKVECCVGVLVPGLQKLVWAPDLCVQAGKTLGFVS